MFYGRQEKNINITLQGRILKPVYALFSYTWNVLMQVYITIRFFSSEFANSVDITPRRCRSNNKPNANQSHHVTHSSHKLTTHVLRRYIESCDIILAIAVSCKHRRKTINRCYYVETYIRIYTTSEYYNTFQTYICIPATGRWFSK